MSTSFLMDLSEATDETSRTLTQHPAIYTNVLTDHDTEFASRYDLNPDGLLSSTSVKDPTMSRERIAIWDLGEVGYRYIPAYYYRDCFSETEDCSWLEASQAIEDHDWASTGEKSGCNHTDNNSYVKRVFR